MPQPELVESRLCEGVWEGILRGAAEKPEVEARHLGRPLDGIELQPLEQGSWRLRVPIPPEVLSDGVQTILLTETATGLDLGRIALAAGEALDGDLRAEIAALRAELDLLKRVVRRKLAGGDPSGT